MKKTIVTCSFCLHLFLLSAQNSTGGSTVVPGGGSDAIKATPTERVNIVPPAAAKEHFEKHHAGSSNVIWREVNGEYHVTYTDPKTKLGHVIVYNSEGKLIRHENELETTTYPETVKKFFIKEYPGEKYSIWESQDEKGSKTYYIPREKEFLWFDENGKLSGKRKRK
jgi:hypothetical protein